MADTNSLIAEVNTAVAQCVTEVKGVRAKIDAGEARAADLDSRIVKMDEHIKVLDGKLAAAEARGAAATSTQIDRGAARNYLGKDGLRLLDTVTERRLDGSPNVQRTVAAGWLSAPENTSEAHVEAKACWELAVVRAITAGAIRFDGEGRVSRSATMAAVNAHAPGLLDRIAVLAESEGMGDANQIRQRVFGVTSGSGSELIPADVLLPEVSRVAGANQRGGLASLFPQRTLTNRNNYIPTRTSLPRPFNKGVASATAAAEIIRSKGGTSRVPFVPQPFACGVDVDRDADEDAVVSLMLEVRADIVAAMTLGLDDAIINGDTDATHQDDGSGALASWNPEGVFSLTGAGGSLDHRKMFLGLRARALDIGSGAKLDLSGTLTAAKIFELHSRMNGGRGMNDGRVAVISDFLTIIKHISTLTEVLTLEKFGPNASILRGQVVSIGGHPVIRTPFMGRSGANTGSFNASGVFATSSVTKQAILLADLDAFTVGTRKGVTLESDANILTDTTSVIATGRFAFASPDHPGAVSSTSTINVAYGYNL